MAAMGGLLKPGAEKIDSVGSSRNLLTLSGVPKPATLLAAPQRSRSASGCFPPAFRRRQLMSLVHQSRPCCRFPERRLRVRTELWRCDQSAWLSGDGVDLAAPVGTAGGTDFADRQRHHAFDAPDASGVGGYGKVGYCWRQRAPTAMRRGKSSGRFTRKNAQKPLRLFRPGAPGSAYRSLLSADRILSRRRGLTHFSVPAQSEKGRERQFRLADDDARFPVGALEGLDYPFFRNWHDAASPWWSAP
jgi:hypothetical protein